MRWVTTLAVIALVVLGLIWLTQRRLIYLPTQAVPDADAVFPEVEEVTYETEDGLTLAAWFVPAEEEAQAGAVIVFNGNAGNRSHRTPLARALAGRGYAVLLVDYRGYGGNPGSPSESGLSADARAAADYLRTRPDIAPNRLVYYGESLGAAVAIGLAETDPPAALVLRSPFTSLPDIGSTHYPYLPTSLLLWDRYPSVERITKVEVPVMVIAGSADRIVPVDQSKAVFDAAPGPKQFVVIDGAGHNDADLTAGDRMIDGITDFLGAVLSGDS